MNDENLTPDERRAFADLPREQSPSDLLEERTVRALRARGLLRPIRSGGLVLTTSWLAAAAAAVCVMLLGAFVLGQSLGSRQTAEAMLAMHQQDSEQAVDAVQQAGAVYQAALSDLILRTASESAEQKHSSREAALRSLYQVADQMVRLAPDDPLATRILQAFEQAQIETGQIVPDEAESQVIWF
jgi:hypothetical protein